MTLGFAALRAGIGRPLGDEDIAAAVRAAAGAETALVFVGRSGEWDTEGSDLLDIALPGRQDALVAAVLAANPRTVVVLQTGGPVEMPWLDAAPAVLQAWYPGQEAGNAIADVLFGDVEPSGRLPQTFPRRWADNPTGGQDPLVYPGLDGRVRYDEGVFIGYRHYERHGIVPLFPFGHGLGYTTFDLSGLEVAASGAGAEVRVTLANTGERRGTTVVQVYVGDRESSLPRPIRELEAFAKVTLDPGETRTLTLDLPPAPSRTGTRTAGGWRPVPSRSVPASRPPTSAPAPTSRCRRAACRFERPPRHRRNPVPPRVNLHEPSVDAPTNLLRYQWLDPLRTRAQRGTAAEHGLGTKPGH